MMKRIMLSCRDVSRLLSAQREKSLGLKERLALKIHLMFCVFCRRYARQLHWVDNAFHTLGHQKNPPHMNDAAKARIRDMLKDATSRNIDDSN